MQSTIQDNAQYNVNCLQYNLHYNTMHNTLQCKIQCNVQYNTIQLPLQYNV